MRNRRVFVVKYLNGFRRACLQPATAPDDDARISTPWRLNCSRQVREIGHLPCRIPFPSFFVCRICLLFCLS